MGSGLMPLTSLSHTPSTSISIRTFSIFSISLSVLDSLFASPVDSLFDVTGVFFSSTRDAIGVVCDLWSHSLVWHGSLRFQPSKSVIRMVLLFIYFLSLELELLCCYACAKFKLICGVSQNLIRFDWTSGV